MIFEIPQILLVDLTMKMGTMTTRLSNFKLTKSFFDIIWKNLLDKIISNLKISQPSYDIEKERAREEKRLNGEEFEQEFDSDESSLTERR